MLEVFYAGGSARRDFSAAELVAEIVEGGPERGLRGQPSALAAAVMEGGETGGIWSWWMGARDPSLTTDWPSPSWEALRSAPVPARGACRADFQVF